jgi:hypothetical protein
MTEFDPMYSVLASLHSVISQFDVGRHNPKSKARSVQHFAPRIGEQSRF